MAHGHPSITTVARDRGGGDGEAIAKALPHADQVADCWHLMENAAEPFSTKLANPCGRFERPSAAPS